MGRPCCRNGLQKILHLKGMAMRISPGKDSLPFPRRTCLLHDVQQPQSIGGYTACIPGQVCGANIRKSNLLPNSFEQRALMKLFSY